MHLHLFTMQILACLAESESKRVGTIAGMNLFSSTDVILMNGTCDQCICAMLTTETIVSTSCLSNQSCLLFHNHSALYDINVSANDSFHFLVLPPEQSYVTTETSTVMCLVTCQHNGTCLAPSTCLCPSQWHGALCEAPVCSPSCENSGNCTEPGVCKCYYGWTGSYCQTVTTVLWSFDNTFGDSSGQFSGIGRNSPTFIPGINGYGSALALNGTRGQCVVGTPYLNMSYISFTWEFWIYSTITPTGDSQYVGHCYHATPSKCMVFMTRNDQMLFAFWYDDVFGSTYIAANRWYHMAFVYDITANRKSIYLDGVLEGSQNTGGPLAASTANFTFGCRTTDGCNTFTSFFTGYLDEVLYNSRVKNASEILNSATLVAYFRFLSATPLMDSGPNSINGSWSGGTVSIAAGIVDQAIEFPADGSYFQLTGLVLLGTANRSMSLSFWFKINALNGSATLAYISSAGQCMTSIGLISNGTIEIGIFNTTVLGFSALVGVWNHLVYTFSPVRGLHLYANGTLHTALNVTYSALNSPATLTFASTPAVVPCASTAPYGQFYGSLDQVRLYSREISASETGQLYSSP